MRRLSFLSAAGAIALIAGAAPSHAQAPETDICKKDPKFRELDYILGSWDVYSGEKKTAEVKMELILKDCVIRETWTVTNGRPTGNGIGLLNYSPLLKNWGYYWATDNGSATSFRGSLNKPGEVLYVTEKPMPDGKVRLRHWTLGAMPDGTIDELSVGSDDGGKTWTTEYQLKWVHKTSP